MKRNLILTILACGAGAMLSTAAQAQSPTPAPAASPAASPAVCPAGPHHGGKGDVLEKLSAALGLTDAQKAQIAPIVEGAKPQLKAIREEAQAKRKAVIDATSAQITPLLTPDQQTKFTQLVQQFENHAGPGGPGGFKHHGGFGAAGPGNLLEHMTAKLGLSTDQQNQIKPILDAAHAQVVAVHQDTTLTKEQKFAKVKETMEAAHSQINGILTPAQQQQAAAFKAQFHHGHGGPEAQPSASPSVSGT